jgi:hypothetical protein
MSVEIGDDRAAVPAAVSSEDLDDASLGIDNQAAVVLGGDVVAASPARASEASSGELSLPAGSVLKVVKARADVLQTKAAKDIICRSASIFAVYLASA